MNLFDFNKRFPDEEACVKYLKEKLIKLLNHYDFFQINSFKVFGISGSIDNLLL